jgi:response regulator RpfG family c-di-GMP phosphodiesterase
MNSNHNPDATQSALRVLIVDDSPEDAILVAQILRNINFPLSWERMENENDYILQLQTPPDPSLLTMARRSSMPCRR